jgi:outer membrane protein OmpA-like peptidoglycan-associated protein
MPGQPPSVQSKPITKPLPGQVTPNISSPGAQNQPPVMPKQPSPSLPAGQGSQPPSAAGVAPQTQTAPISPSGVPPLSAGQARPIAPNAAGAGIAPLSSNGQPLHRMDQLHSERHESVEGNRTIIREPDRTIIREGQQTIIRHDETDRFRYGARDVHLERRGNENIMVVVRPNGDRIVDTIDENGFLIRRARILPDGREIIIIDDHPREHRFDPRFGFGSFFVDLPPPVIRMPRDRYIVDDDRANQALIYETLIAPPVDAIERPYSLDEIRYSAPLRDRMPRIDLDTLTFDTGSWELTPDQIERLAIIADGLNRAITRNPREVFLIEGFTDAVGSDVDNLSLSDRRAESVAIALTQHFGVPAENLATQGYGAQYLKVPTSGPERANRRVTVQRITPLLIGQRD